MEQVTHDDSNTCVRHGASLREYKGLAINVAWTVSWHEINLIPCTLELTTVSEYHTGMLGDFDNKTLKLQRGDKYARVRDVLIAVICILIYVHETSSRRKLLLQMLDLINLPMLKTTLSTQPGGYTDNGEEWLTAIQIS
jgi:hypothetical protein